MIIKDTKGFYELKADKKRRLVYETATGALGADDYTRMTDEYVNKIIPYLGSGKWAKFCDIRESKPNTSNSPDHMNKELARVVPSGFSCAVLLITSATLKMQVNRVAKGVVEIGYFDDTNEADKWLKEKGF